MSWASAHVDRLEAGETVQFRPRGQSMKGRINSGQLCTVEPLGDKPLEVGEVVLCCVRGSHYLHLVKAIGHDGVQIGNNRGGINGWTPLHKVYGRCVRVEN